MTFDLCAGLPCALIRTEQIVYLPRMIQKIKDPGLSERKDRDFFFS